MFNHCQLMLNAVNEETITFIKKLAPILEKIGITLSFSDIEETKVLSIYYNDKDVEKKLYRNAGRRKKIIMKDKNLDPIYSNREDYLNNVYTWGEIKDLIEREGVSKTQKKVGISYSTFYRRLKECRDNNYNDNNYF